MKTLRALLLSCLMIQPVFALDVGAPSLATNQVTVAATATLVADSRPNRVSVTITNLGTTDTFCGAAGVTATTGTLLVGTKGASIKMDTRAAVFCIVASSTQPVSFIEIF